MPLPQTIGVARKLLGDRPFLPTHLPDLMGWWKADQLALSAGNNVTSWADLSGNGNDLSAPGTAPTYQLASGASVVRTATTAYMRKTGLAVNPRALSVFGVLAPAAAASNTKVLAFGPSAALVWNQTSAGVEWGMQTTQLSLYGLPIANSTFYAAGFVCYADGGIAMWQNGRKSYRLQNGNGSVGPSGTLTDFYLSAIAGPANNWAGDYKELLIYNRALTDAEVQQLLGYLAWRHGLALVTSGDLIVFDGNSQTVGYSSANPGYTDRVIHSLLPFAAYNVAGNGQTIVDLSNDAAAQIDVLRGPYVRNILVCWEATNYLQSVQNPTTVYNAIVSYCQARRSAGWKVVILTCLPRTSAGTYAGFETDRNTLNTNIVTNWATFADALADVGADTTIGEATDPDNTTYYSDKLHLTSTGYVTVDSIVRTAIGTV